jgi:hypothetical protein
MRKPPPERPSDISQEDWDAVDVPEATAEDFARARPFKEVFPDLDGRLRGWLREHDWERMRISLVERAIVSGRPFWSRDWRGLIVRFPKEKGSL